MKALACNLLAVVLLASQCGCGHTYFAWSKPLPLEQTDGQSFVPAEPVPALFGAYDLMPGDFRDTKELRRDAEQAARSFLRKH